MKKTRQMKVLEIISKNEVETQDDLISLLEKEGVYVTQATISRDIRELDLVKVSTSRGTYKYTVASHIETEKKKATNLGNALLTAITGVDYAQNIVVVKTIPGMSNAVAIELEGQNIPDMLGCVAGDDTLMIVMKSEMLARELSENFKDIIVGK